MRTRRCAPRLLAVHDQHSRDLRQLRNVQRRPCPRRGYLGQHQSGRCTAEVFEIRVAIKAMTQMTKRSDQANEKSRSAVEQPETSSAVFVRRRKTQSCTADGEAETLRRNVTTAPYRLSRSCRSFKLALVIRTLTMKKSRFSFGVCSMRMQPT